MKFLAICTLLGGVMGSGAVLAQAPAGVLQRPPAEVYPNLAGGSPQLVAEMRAEAARRATTDDVTIASRLDMNRDGLISRTEWDKPLERGISIAEYQDTEIQPATRRYIRGTPK